MHHCVAGCVCGGNRAAAVEYAYSLLERLVVRRLPVPSANRWLHVFPAVAMLTMSVGLHKIFLRAFLELGQYPDGADSDPSGDDAIGAPQVDEQAFQRAQRRRARKMRDFLSDPQVDMKLLLWLACSSHVLHMHFRLFAASANLGAGLDGMLTELPCV